MKPAAPPAFISPTLILPTAAFSAHPAVCPPAIVTVAPPNGTTRVQRTRLAVIAPLSRPVSTSEEDGEYRQRRKLLDEAYEVFRERFVNDGAINWARVERRLRNRPLHSDQHLQAALSWLFAHADDPFTRYLTPAQLDAMKHEIDGEICGVGIVFNAENAGWLRNKRVVITHVVRRSPAADAGMMKGDCITAIDMVSVRNMSFDDVTARLMGKEGKKVLLSFSRASQYSQCELHMLLTRRRFQVPTVSWERLNVAGIGNVAYIQLREFASNTATQTRRAVRKMAGTVDLYVLDMRGNAGGLVDKAVEVAKVFLERDRIIVRFVGRNGAQTTERCGWRFWRPRVHATKKPIVVLVDADTASASELVAAALRDNCRAVVVGDSTYGKGSVQAILPLSNGAGVAVTVAKYKTPKDDSIIFGRGLRPDLFQSNLAEDADGALRDLFGRGGEKRLRWIVGRLDKCVAPDCAGGRSQVTGRARVDLDGRRRLLESRARTDFGN